MATFAFALYFFVFIIVFGWIADRRDASGDTWK